MEDNRLIGQDTFVHRSPIRRWLLRALLALTCLVPMIVAAVVILW